MSINDKLLVTLDKQGVEWPDDFDRASSIQKVEDIKRGLETALGVPLSLESSAQDATFHCNLGGIHFDAGANCVEYFVCLTFSNFGGLCLMWGEQDWFAQKVAELNAANTLLIEHGYVPLRPEDVAHAYCGCHAEWSGKTWLDRFFSHY